MSLPIFENFSRSGPFLCDFRRPRTNGTYLAVLADAIRRYGAPEAMVTDGGGSFYSNMALPTL